MAWITVAGLVGKVYRPDRSGCPPLKHACQNCFSCQGCDENRCRVCRNDPPRGHPPPPPPASAGVILIGIRAMGVGPSA